MKKKQLKVCGIRYLNDVEAIAGLGADFIGMIFYPPSSRFAGDAIDAELFFELKRRLTGIQFVGVFVDADKEYVQLIAAKYGLSALQFHGQESAEYCRFFLNDYTVIKAISISGANDFDCCTDYEDSCHLFLFDTAGLLRGGNGKSWDWSLLSYYSCNVPFLISGGVAPEDGMKLNTVAHPKFVGVDINSKFELYAGKKNIEAVVDFMKVLNPKSYEIFG